MHALMQNGGWFGAIFGPGAHFIVAALLRFLGRQIVAGTNDADLFLHDEIDGNSSTRHVSSALEHGKKQLKPMDKELTQLSLAATDETNEASEAGANINSDNNARAISPIAG